MVSRREMLVGSLSCATGLCPRLARAQDFPVSDKIHAPKEPEAAVCGDNHAPDDLDQFPKISSSGNAEFDQSKDTEISVLNNVFRVNPDFYFINDGGLLVAATKRRADTSVIYFASSLVQDEIEQNPYHWDSAIVGILAHEWTHAFQYQSRLQENVHIWEEHADFMAGWYLGTKFAAGMSGVDAEAFAESLYSKGSPKGFWDPNDYGSPAERAQNSLAGFSYAKRTFVWGNLPDIYPAAQYGFDYIKSSQPNK